MRQWIVKEGFFGRQDELFGEYTPIIQCCREATWFISISHRSFHEHPLLFPCPGLAAHIWLRLRHVRRDGRSKANTITEVVHQCSSSEQPRILLWI